MSEQEKTLLPAPVEKFEIGAFNIKNFEEIKEQLEIALKKYENVEVTDEFYGEAKTTRAELNKVATALDNRRKELEKRYMEPFNVGKAQINTLVDMVKKVSGKIDTGIKAIEEAKRKEKEKACIEVFESIENPHNISLESVWKDSWLNAGTSLKKVGDEINAEFVKVDTDIKTIRETIHANDKARADAVVEFYLTNGHDLSEALSREKTLYDYSHRKPIIQPAKEEDTPQSPEPQVTDEPPHHDGEPEDLQSICFRVWGTKEELMKLGDYIRDHELTFETIGR